MKEKIGNYVIIYSDGTSANMGMTGESKAIAKARERGIKDPGLRLVEITGQGGCVIRWKRRSLGEWLREMYWKISAFLYLKFRRLIAIGQTFG